jgi:hypothetical protein
MGGRPRDPARMFEGPRLCGVKAPGGRAGKEVGRRLISPQRSRIDMKPKTAFDQVDPGDGDQDTALRYASQSRSRRGQGLNVASAPMDGWGKGTMPQAPYTQPHQVDLSEVRSRCGIRSVMSAEPNLFPLTKHGSASSGRTGADNDRSLCSDRQIRRSILTRLRSPVASLATARVNGPARRPC